MSHFSVLVIGDNVEEQLAPYHEFECTGEDNEFVQNVDKLAEAQEDYANYGKGEDQTFAEFVEGWYGLNPVGPGEQPDLGGEHKYGWLRATLEGDVTEAVRRTNPNKHWDWWIVGGRWTGFFWLKPGRTGELGDIGVPDRFASHEERVALAIERTVKADRALKGDIDFAAMRAEAVQKAGDLYDRARVLIGDRPFQTWEEVRDAHPDNIEAAWDAYGSQPAVQALRDSEDTELRWYKPDEFQVSREEYTRRAGDAAVRTFAVVKDGQWYEKGAMGWFACVSNEKGDEWDSEFAALLDGLPDDTLLTVVDCHI